MWSSPESDNFFNCGYHGRSWPSLQKKLQRAPSRANLSWLRTALRRSGRILAWEGLEVDIARGRIRRHGQEMKLSQRQRQLLRVLVEGDGAVIAYPELVRRVWGSPGAHGTHHLRWAIRALRQKIEADPRTPAHILTVARVGYRFRAKPIPPSRQDTGRNPSQGPGP